MESRGKRLVNYALMKKVADENKTPHTSSLKETDQPMTDDETKYPHSSSVKETGFIPDVQENTHLLIEKPNMPKLMELKPMTNDETKNPHSSSVEETGLVLNVNNEDTNVFMEGSHSPKLMEIQPMADDETKNPHSSSVEETGLVLNVNNEDTSLFMEGSHSTKLMEIQPMTDDETKYPHSSSVKETGCITDIQKNTHLLIENPNMPKLMELKPMTDDETKNPHSSSGEETGLVLNVNNEDTNVFMEGSHSPKLMEIQPMTDEETKYPHSSSVKETGFIPDVQENTHLLIEKPNMPKLMEETIKLNSQKTVFVSAGCSHWTTIADLGSESNLKLRLRKVNDKNKEAFSSDSVLSEADDTDADPDFSCLDNENQFRLFPRHRTTITDSSEDDLFLPTRAGTMQDLQHNIDQLSSSDNSDEEQPQTEKRKGKKKRAAPALWSRNKKKFCRNKGEAYISNSKNPKEVAARELKAPCNEKCKLKCPTKISQQSRQAIFDSYWSLGSLQLQREFVSKLLTEVKPVYSYKREGSTRSANHAFHLVVNEQKIRVCKLFFKATLDINDRPIRTVLNKSKDCIIEQEKRGKHGHQKTVDDGVKEGIREHIKSIPRVESHYLRAQTTREFIEGGKSIASIHRDYVKKCEEQNIPCGNITMFTRIFNEEFNISFFTPKKDQCELCTAYANAQGIDKENLREQYNGHLKEKDLSRVEKKKDKELALVNKNVVVASYDLQAVLPAPRGEVSVFYYKSKLNSYNLTVTELNLQKVNCYFWHEGEGKRGSIEIGTCVYKFLQTIALEKNDEDLEIILYSDNCCGQQKNSFIFSMYLYAIQTLKIKSITHKFLIKGHTQNEGDNVHSVIEKSVKKSLKTGPIYTPDEYIRIIRSSKATGIPYRVTELSHKDFIDWKTITTQIGSNFTTISKETDAAYANRGECVTGNEDQMDTDFFGVKETKKTTKEKEKKPSKKVKVEEHTIKFGDIKIVQVHKEESCVLRVKTSYQEEHFLKIKVDETKLKRGQKKPPPVDFLKIIQTQAYQEKPHVSDNKKRDILSLISGNHIPQYYEQYYKSVFNS